MMEDANNSAHADNVVGFYNPSDGREFDTSRNVSDEEIAQWAALRADDAGFLARKLISERNTVGKQTQANLVAWTSQDQLNDANESGMGYLYAGGWKPDKAEIPLFIHSVPSPTAEKTEMTEAHQQAQAALDKVMNCRFSNFDAGAVIHWVERGMYQVKTDPAPASNLEGRS